MGNGNQDAMGELVVELKNGRVGRRQFLRRAIGLGVTVTSAGAIFAACTSGSSQTGGRTGETAQIVRGGTLTVATTPPGLPVDPHMSGDPGGRATFAPTVNYLVREVPGKGLQPELATEWTSDDARSWTFKLREGVTFHNDQPLTAKDVAATFERLVDPDSGSSATSVFASVLSRGGAEVVDDHTVTFHLDRAVSSFPYSTYVYQAAILPADLSEDFTQNPIGTGPFRLVNYEAGNGAEYEPNEAYWKDGLPYLAALNVRFFEDFGAQVTAIQSGEVDLLLDVTPDAVDVVSAGSEDVEVLFAESAAHSGLAMRVDTEPFDDKRVRQAIALCLRRESIVDELWSGNAAIANDHLFGPAHDLTDRLTLPQQRDQDYERARALLAEAGFPDGVDLELRTHDLWGLPSFAQVVQEMVEPANIRIELKVEPDDIFFQHWNTFPFILEAWSHRHPATMMGLAYRCRGDWNVPHWCNEEFDELLNQLDAAVEEEEQVRVSENIATLMNEETPAIITYFYKSAKAIRSRVKGQGPVPVDYINHEETWVEQ